MITVVIISCLLLGAGIGSGFAFFYQFNTIKEARQLGVEEAVAHIAAHMTEYEERTNILRRYDHYDLWRIVKEANLLD